ncbi:efflux RND transporter periplasmic adaptor subunit, partial [Candidatus Roizmanbacteria bacterium]|nr:efflux RND transporter periplasmic adaptor subunit [Candidatus Roizmanbacteria bacterium]
YIHTEQSKKYVWKLENNKRIKTFITLGDEVDGTSVIKSGLREGDVIGN